MPATSDIRWILPTLFLAGVACVAASGCHKAVAPSSSEKTAPAIAKEVTVVVARLEPWPQAIRVQGSLLAFEDAVVGSKLAGRIATVDVDLGSIVRRGQPIVALVRDELDLRVQLAEAQLRQACAAIGITPAEDEGQFKIATAPGVMLEQALVNEAQSNVNRARPLVATRTVTEAEYDTMTAQLKAAQARYNAALNAVGEQVSVIGVRRKELALARQAVADSQVLAPFDGVVGERLVSPGEYVSAGQAVITLVRADKLRFTAGVPESSAAAIRVGQRVELELGERDSPPVVTAISRVSPTVMQSSRSILIEADVPNPNLKYQAGLFAEAELVVDPDAAAVVVPSSAVSRFAGVQKVWIVTDGVAKQQTVRTGREEKGRVEIVDGLVPGAVLARNATDGYDGPVIAIQEQPRKTLQAKLPETSPPTREEPGGGAQ
jgi:membrane fusion protein, multidrug efflux system